MNADRVEVSWDEQKSKWLVRIIVGEEVIRRYCRDPKNTDPAKLRASAAQTAVDEGYQVAESNISLLA